MSDRRFEKLIVDAERRRFLRSSLMLGAVALVGCGGGQSTPSTGKPANDDSGAPPNDTGSSGTDSTVDDARIDETGDATPACLDTDDNIEGPFFKPSSPERTNLVEPGITGTMLLLTGRVFFEGCAAPLSNALLDFWQANDAGAYDDVKLRGHQYAGADGSYTLSTIIPGHYLNGAQYRPSHIHVKVGGAAAGAQLLTTQLYFEGDPYNAIDPFIKPSLIMKVATLADGSRRAKFDFVIRKA